MKSLIRFQQRRWVPGQLLLALLLAAAPAAAEDVPDAAAGLPALLEFYAAHSAIQLPALSSHDVAALGAGDAVVKVSSEAAADDKDDVVAMGVYGLKIVEAPRLLIWLAVMGGNDERDYRLTTAILGRGNAGSYERYQHIKLPWPVRDRHWVIHCEKNPDIAVASDGRFWEHRWNLAQGGHERLHSALRQRRISGMTLQDANNAIYLPENSGAWTMVELDARRTLVIAYVNADLGGRFPGPVVRHFTINKLEAGLASLQELSSRVHLNYSENRPIHDGFGKLVSRQQALQAAEDWPGAHRALAAD